MESQIAPAFDITYGQAKHMHNSANIASRSLSSDILPCTDPLFGNKQRISNDSISVTDVNGTMGCFSSAQNLQGKPLITTNLKYLLTSSLGLLYIGKFAFNYDTKTQRAVAEIPLSDGIICTNCYISGGDNFKILVEYKDDIGMNFQGTFGGNYEQNIEIKLNNTAFQGMAFIPVLSSAEPIVIELPSIGMNVSYIFDGMYSLLYGTALVENSATFGGKCDNFSLSQKALIVL